MAIVHVVIAYEKDEAKISTEIEHAPVRNDFSASKVVQEAATRAGATSGSGAQNNGDDFGLGMGAHGRQVGNVTILSDTKGVDFAGYLQQDVLRQVRENWYGLIPESARWKHGTVIIEFAVTKDGNVESMKLAASSGDSPLDRAAWASILNSSPFPPLPKEFAGPYLALRVRFFYNPTKSELAPAN